MQKLSGETWRKLTFKCTVALDSRSTCDQLRPNQLCVGVKAGVEVMVHASRKWVIDHTVDSDAVFLERDVENAYNGANPGEFLRDCAEHMPNSARFAEFCYGTPVNMGYRGSLETSCRGQQG